MEEIEIPLSKKKKTLLFACCICFIIFSILIIVNPEKYTRFGRSPEFLKVFGIVALIFCCIGLARLLKKVNDKIGITINHEGITDNSSGLKSLFIDWKSITGIRVSNVMSTKFLLLDTNDPQKYIQENGNLKGNYNLYGTPLMISAVALKCNFDELEKIVRTEFEKYNSIVPNS